MDSLEQNLKEIIGFRGWATVDEPFTLERLLLEKHPDEQVRIRALMSALYRKVPMLMKAADGVLPVESIDSLTTSLAERESMEATTAQWAVRTWAAAIGKQVADPQSSLPTTQAPVLPPTPQVDVRQWEKTPAAPITPPVPSTNPQGYYPAQPPQYGAPPTQPGAWPQAPYAGYGFDSGNTSGMRGFVPLEIEPNKWNWGAFTFGWLWLAFNGMGLYALLFFIANMCTGGIAHLVIGIIIGINGNSLAWQNRRFENLQHFREVTRAWNQWGIGVFIAYLVIIVIYFIVAVLTGLGSAMSGTSSHP